MKKRLLTFLIVSTWLLPACAGFGVLRDMDLSHAEQQAGEKKYQDALVSYETIARESAGSARGAQALLSAAKLRTFHDNPQKDYAGALQAFDDFIRRYPDDEQISDAVQWRSFVKVILDLKKENEALNKKIEQLKKIDIKHEEKRRRR